MKYYENLTKGRVSEPGRAYSLTIVTANRIPHFNDFSLARSVVKQMRALQDAGQLDSLAWVLMPDHLHWLLILKATELSEVIRLFKGGTAYTLNKKLNRQSAFWQRGFYDHALRKEEELRTVARYIVANPLRAGLVKTVGEYPHRDARWLID